MKHHWRYFLFSVWLALLSWQASARTLADIHASDELRICVAGSSAAFYQANAESFARFLGVRARVTKLESWDKQFHNASGTTDKEAIYDGCTTGGGALRCLPQRFAYRGLARIEDAAGTLLCHP